MSETPNTDEMLELVALMDKVRALNLAGADAGVVATVLEMANEQVEELLDKIDGLESDLDSAVEVAWNRGAKEWVRLNYPKHYRRFSKKQEGA